MDAKKIVMFVIFCIIGVFFTFDINNSNTDPISKNTNTTIMPYLDVEYDLHNKIDETAKYGDLDDIIKRGKLVVCSTKKENPLFQMKVGNGYIGEDIELAYKISKALNVKLVYKIAYESYEDVVNAIENGEGDIGVSKLSYTEQRARKVLFTEPYVISRYSLLVNRLAIERNERKTIKEILNNKDISISVAKGTSYKNYANKLFPNALIQEFKDWEGTVLKEVSSGSLTATMRDEIRCSLLINSYPFLLLKVMPLILKNKADNIHAIVNKKSITLLAWINRFIKSNYTAKSAIELISKYKEFLK